MCGGTLPLPRATARVAPTEGYKRCGEVRYPPVTASPCQDGLPHCKECVGRADVGIGPYEVFTDRIS